jgi:hypothetical protein
LRLHQSCPDFATFNARPEIGFQFGFVAEIIGFDGIGRLATKQKMKGKRCFVIILAYRGSDVWSAERMPR